jgi:hypothetical protein
MCENFESDPLHPEAGVCSELADLIYMEGGVRCSCHVSDTNDASRCASFEMTDAARSELEDDERYEMTPENLQLTPGVDFPGTL